MSLTNTISIVMFAIILILVIYKFRKKFEFQKINGIPIICILKTKFGIKFMKKVAKKHSKFLKVVGYIGMIIAYLGIIAMFILIMTSFLNLFLKPDAPSAVSPVIPGVKIPGSEFYVPFWYGIIALFVVIVFHEFGHGIIAKAHKYKILNTGLVLFLILPGAFVEPDEKKIVKAKTSIQNSVYAAGPWFNVILSVIVFLILIFCLTPVHTALSNNSGFTFTHLDNNSPALVAGLPVNVTYNKIDEAEINSIYALGSYLKNKSPGEEITLYTDQSNSHTLALGTHPNDENQSYIGILGLSNVRGSQSIFKEGLFQIVNILVNLFFWIYVLSLGIGSANLLPIGPLDGGRIVITTLKKYFKEKKAKLIAKNISWLTVIFLLAALIIPIVRAII
jgi:membrane-associated protease RseP (regulator of RpoE activity)